MRPKDFLDIDVLREQLVLADKLATQSESRIAKQKTVLQRLRRSGGDVRAAEVLLRELEQVLKRRIESRDRIRSRLNRRMQNFPELGE